MTLRLSLRLALLLPLLLSAPSLAASSDWTQFGGPNRDFSSPSARLADSWPEDGPRELWRKPLGDHGHATVLAEGDKIYIFFRRGQEDVLRSLDGETGETVWETAYDSPLTTGFNTQFGPGPHSSPAIAGDRIFTVSGTLVLKAFAKASGDEVWSIDLKETMSAQVPRRGFGASPLLYDDLLILPVGGDGQAVVAFRQSDGSVAWKALDGGAAYSSPLLADIGGRDHVVVAIGTNRAGLDPRTGEVLWQLEVPQTATYQMATPTAFGNKIVASQAYEDGTRVFEVTPEGDGFSAQELFYTRKMKVMHGATARIGNRLYGSSGDFGPAFLTALDLDTGQALFRQRGFAKANVVAVGDDRLIILDEDGQLGLGIPKDDGVEILAEAEVLQATAWAAPTLVGTTLFLANRTEIVALDLSEAANASADRVTDAGTSSDGAGAAITAVPERSASGATLEIPASLLDRGFPYFLMRGVDSQVALTLRSPLQRLVATTGNAVGYLVRSHDLEGDGGTPLLGGALRIPLHSLSTGAERADGLLRGAQFFDAANHPEIGVLLNEAKDWKRLASSEGDVNAYQATVAGHLEVRDKKVSFEVPASFTFYDFTQAALSKSFADVAVMEWTLEMKVADLGIVVPPQLAGLVADSVTIDAFLAFDNSETERSLDQRFTQEEHLQQTRFETLLEDLGQTDEAYALAREYAASIQDRPLALATLARAVLGSETKRDLALAKELSERAVALTERNDPQALASLARTHFLLGERARAVELQREAIAAAGDSVPPPVKAGLERGLAEYEGE